MRLARILIVVVVGLGLVAVAPTAQAAAKVKKANKEHPVKGVVASVEKDKDKDSGKITIKIAEHKNKKTGVVKAAEEKTIKVTEATKFVEVSGKKADKKEEAVTFAALKDGEHVTIEVKGDEAVKVTFHAKKAKKAKKNK